MTGYGSVNFEFRLVCTTKLAYDNFFSKLYNNNRQLTVSSVQRFFFITQHIWPSLNCWTCVCVKPGLLPNLNLFVLPRWTVITTVFPPMMSLNKLLSASCQLPFLALPPLALLLCSNCYLYQIVSCSWISPLLYFLTPMVSTVTVLVSRMFQTRYQSWLMVSVFTEKSVDGFVLGMIFWANSCTG